MARSGGGARRRSDGGSSGSRCGRRNAMGDMRKSRMSPVVCLAPSVARIISAWSAWRYLLRSAFLRLAFWLRAFLLLAFRRLRFFCRRLGRGGRRPGRGGFDWHHRLFSSRENRLFESRRNPELNVVRGRDFDRDPGIGIESAPGAPPHVHEFPQARQQEFSGAVDGFAHEFRQFAKHGVDARLRDVGSRGQHPERFDACARQVEHFISDSADYASIA